MVLNSVWRIPKKHFNLLFWNFYSKFFWTILGQKTFNFPEKEVLGIWGLFSVNSQIASFFLLVVSTVSPIVEEFITSKTSFVISKRDFALLQKTRSTNTCTAITIYLLAQTQLRRVVYKGAQCLLPYNFRLPYTCTAYDIHTLYIYIYIHLYIYKPAKGMCHRCFHMVALSARWPDFREIFRRKRRKRDRDADTENYLNKYHIHIRRRCVRVDYAKGTSCYCLIFGGISVSLTDYSETCSRKFSDLKAFTKREKVALFSKLASNWNCGYNNYIVISFCNSGTEKVIISHTILPEKVETICLIRLGFLFSRTFWPFW